MLHGYSFYYLLSSVKLSISDNSVISPVHETLHTKQLGVSFRCLVLWYSGFLLQHFIDSMVF